MVLKKKRKNMISCYGIDVWGMLLLVTSRNYSLFFFFFARFDVTSFKCEVCELAKSRRPSFPLTLNKSLVLFMVIHSNV